MVTCLQSETGTVSLRVLTLDQSDSFLWEIGVAWKHMIVVGAIALGVPDAHAVVNSVTCETPQAVTILAGVDGMKPAKEGPIDCVLPVVPAGETLTAAFFDLTLTLDWITGGSIDPDKFITQLEVEVDTEAALFLQFPDGTTTTILEAEISDDERVGLTVDSPELLNNAFLGGDVITVSQSVVFDDPIQLLAFTAFLEAAGPPQLSVLVNLNVEVNGFLASINVAEADVSVMATFESSSDQITPIPVSATLPLFLTGLVGAGIAIGRRRSV